MPTKKQLTKAGQPRKNAPGQGRPKGSGKGPDKVKLTVHILPETKEAIGALGPYGEVLDRTFGKQSKPKKSKS